MGERQWPYGIPGHVLRQSKHWNPDLVEQMVRAGRVQQADSLTELAGQLGVPAEAFEGTIAAYNAGAADGEDRQFTKKAQFLVPVATPTFYGAELRPATVASTACGLRISPAAEVLDDRVVGAQYVGSGNNYANCATMGYLAGRSAAHSLV